MRHEAVWQPDAEYPRCGPAIREGLPDRGPEAAGEDALLDGDEQVVLGRELAHEAGVDRLREASVGDGHVVAVLGKQVRGLEGLAHAAAVADERDTLALAQDLAGPDLDRLRRVRHVHADAVPTRVAKRD